MLAPAECRRCGVCCHSASPTYVRVTGDDWSRLGDAADRWVRWEGNRAYLRMENGRCAALRVTADPSPNGTHDFFCSIYDRRPQLCRDLERGSPQCEGERAAKGSGVAGSLPA